MRRVVVTGGPGASKTTLLTELARCGFATVSESAREVIVERLARGESPRPDPEIFAREILRRDFEKYAARQGNGEVIFYDRSAVEALGMVNEVAPLHDDDLTARLNTYRFYKTVFVLPPWKAIYRKDSERDHSFEHAERVHGEVVRWYRRCGYEINEVPCLPVEQRANHVVHSLAHNGDA